VIVFASRSRFPFIGTSKTRKIRPSRIILSITQSMYVNPASIVPAGLRTNFTGAPRPCSMHMPLRWRNAQRGCTRGSALAAAQLRRARAPQSVAATPPARDSPPGPSESQRPSCGAMSDTAAAADDTSIPLPFSSPVSFLFAHRCALPSSVLPVRDKSRRQPPLTVLVVRTRTVCGALIETRRRVRS
jgi:hypothetical protein